MRDIFNTQVIEDIDSDKCVAKLIEEKTKDIITISHIPSDSFLIKLDVDKGEFKQKSAYFKKTQSFIHKGCDYCLICESQKKIILIELKSKSPKGYLDQFAASEIFIKYCCDLWNYKKKELHEFEFLRILFSKADIRQPTKGVLKKIHKNPAGIDIPIIYPGFPKYFSLAKVPGFTRFC